MFFQRTLQIKKVMNTKNIFSPHMTGTSIEAKQRIGIKNIIDLKKFFN